MIALELRTAAGTAPYLLGEGVLERAGELLAPHLGGRRAFVVTDTVVGPLHGRAVANRLGAPLLEIPDGEEHKRWPSVEAIARWLLESGVERDDPVVAVGGGVVTDIAGFAASIVLRGLPWVAVPTTLLAMVDAALGGKTGIDTPAGKNLLGTFWPPRALLADPRVLATLPLRQLRSGLVEVVKAAMLEPQALTPVLDRRLVGLARGELAGAAELIAAAARVKSGIVARDEREEGPRAALNLGHTLGHALEAATGYRRFVHGEAVAWGLLAVLRVAVERALLDGGEARAWTSRLEALAPFPAVADLAWEELDPFVRRDKKRSGGEVAWVLPRRGGVLLGARVAPAEAQSVFGRLQALDPSGPFASLF